MEREEKARVSILAVVVALTLAFLALDLLLPLGVAGGATYMAVVLATLWLPGYRYTLAMAATGVVLTAVGFYLSPPGGELWIGIVNRALALFVIGVTGILVLRRKQFEQRIRENEERTRELEASRQAAVKDAEEAERARRLTEEAEARFRSLIENASDLITVLGPDGRFRFQSPSVQRVLDYTPEELVGQDAFAFLHPDCLVEAMATLQEVVRNPGVTKSLSVRFRHKDGSWRYLDLVGKSVVGDSGEPLVVLNSRDVTEQVETREALRQEKERAQQYLDVAGSIIVALDAQGHVTLINQRGCELLGYAADEILGKDWFEDFVAAEARETWRADFRELMAGESEGRQEFERPITTSAGEKRIILWQNRVLKDSNGALVGVLRSGVDITERKEAEAALLESEERFRLLAESALTGVYLIQDNLLRYVNAAFARIFGYQVEEIIDRLGPLDLTAPQDRELVAGNISNRIEGRAPATHYFFTGLRKDKTLVDIEVHGARIDYKGKPAIVGTLTDVTERKRAEQALARQAGELAQSNTELEQFAYVASHDLQEPLRAVASYVQLLARRYEGKLDAKADVYIHHAVQGANRMQQLLNGLLAYSRVGTRGQPFAPVDCEALLASVLNDLHVVIEESKATVTHDPLPRVMADESQLGQAFQNLIGNAIKFRGADPPRVHISAEERGDHYVFSVRDNGIGIDPQYFDRIFVIFQRLHSREDYPGTGVGLAVCKKIVERHGGRVWVESEPGRGATFFFTIPKPRDR